MKRIALMVLAGVLALSAAEWETVQITDEADLWSTDPILVLDAQWHPHILFTQWNEEVHIKVASHDTDLWIIDDVATVSEDFMPYYSIDVDAQGNTYIAYFDLVGVGNSDLFFASDKDGPFAPVNITDDELFQVAPHVRVSFNGVPFILYAEALTPDDSMRLFIGSIDEEGLHSPELIAKNVYQEEYLGYDLVFEPRVLISPHVFYIGDDGYLWHVTLDEDDIIWRKEPLNELSSEWPSAVADPLGSFHVAYDVGGASIHYITNMSGTWQDELVSDLGDPEGGNERPSLALEIVYGGYLGIGNPHVVWMHADAEGPYDFYYARRPEDNWLEESVFVTPEKDELPGYGRYFALDAEGYGHLVYHAEDENYVTQIFYARSKEPLIGGITENPPQSTPLSLKVRGGAVCFSLPQTGLIRLDLYDAAGRRVTCIASGAYPVGEHSIPLNLAELPAGVYFVHLESTNQQASAKFVVMR
ncbi:hypothetical protein CEE36_00840 [candidate division TA06 bacterium B3_TA06]|uniref:Secretion system C-terminal sorting domain-containing protein n=1 Tax=candidate division TA06 bacterium B3_TA06 TaxID=2012487 RepID=A0A532VAX2_UNCT6|nr:MAG: hypothetical protein CEE36_00840 [candidate division TA06 bacterium B3_TA06]